MKYSFAIATIVVAVAAQGLTSLPQCGQLCVNNMIQVANSQFGCANGDAACYCRNENFGLGLRDCAGQACGADVQSQVVSYGNAYCSSAAGGGAMASAATTVSSVASSAASVSSSASRSASSVASSAASAASSVMSSAASAASSRAASATSSAASAAVSGNYAPVMTAAPFAGALAAAAMLVL